MRKESAFSLSEVLIVMAVIAILAGITLPVLAQVEGSAKEKQCWSNLHQLQLAIAMYRTDNNGDGVYGIATHMGLPPDMADLPTVLHLPIAVFHCTAPPNILSPEQAVYVKMFSDSTRNRPYPSWGTFVASAGENTVIFADMNHGDRSVPISSPFFAHKGIGVRLDGQVFTQTRIGNWNDPVWWQSP